MDYYLLQADEVIKNPISLKSFTRECGSHFDDIAIQEKIDISTNIVDYIQKRMLFENRYFFSDKIKEILDEYDDIRGSRVVFVLGTNTQYVYWELKFNLVDRVIDKKCSKVEMITLHKDIIKNLNFFAIQIEKQEYLIFEFEVAERMMQIFPLGLKFKPIQVI